ncbi:MAG TPA: DUF4625 domain-containing protein [Cryomorphaceae bacterium]|nr:DUF4625 domain-containing protein [Cryomorphaceae bacterium]
MLQKAGLFFIFLLILACSKEDDREDPVITGLTISQESLSPGENLTISVWATDNEDLGQVRIRIREAFSKSFGAWEALRVINISGNTLNSTFALTVPDTALAGYYEVSTQVSDERGNGSVDSTLFFTILQSELQPVISGFETNPPLNVDNELNLNFNDSLTFSGVVVDSDGLNQIEIEFQSFSGSVIDNRNYNLGDTIQSWNFEQFADTIVATYQENPPAHLIIRATDSQGHLTRNSFSVNYTP